MPSTTHQGTTYIIGAGLSGLSAATMLASNGQRVCVYEAAAQAGGRCRSYYDPSFGGIIDNGNHLLLSGNVATLAYLKRVGANVFETPRQPVFDFIDAQNKERWSLRLNKGRIPFWLFDKSSRIAGTRIRDYFSALRLLCAKPEQTVASLLDTESLLYKRLWHPVLLAALNTDLSQASAKLAGAVLNDTVLKGGTACVPMVAEGLSSAFVDPALQYLTKHNVTVLFNQRIRSIAFNEGKAAELQFAEGNNVTLDEADTLICAAPAAAVPALLPGIHVPTDTRAILNAHFRTAPPENFPSILGVTNATTEWIFTFADRISVTVSNADRLMQIDREELAQQIWQEVADITGLAPTLPPWQIVKEKRATLAATPPEDAKRPGTLTPWKNVFLAGDYVQTGLPATIEGAIRSGVRAAELSMK